MRNILGFNFPSYVVKNFNAAINTVCFPGNYVLMGKFDEELAGVSSSMEYHLVSAVQLEKGRRQFWPHFGFFYKAIATKVEVYFYDITSAALVKIMDEGLVNDVNNPISKASDWKYLSKNLSTITEFTDMWKTDTEKSWKVSKQLFHVCILLYIITKIHSTIHRMIQYISDDSSI